MWNKISKRCKMPRKGRCVDLWHSEYGRLTNYQLIKDYGGSKGNNFFEPIVCGPTTIRYEDSDLAESRIYWMYPPPPPKKNNS